MQINPINNTNFQSRFVPNETLKRGFDAIKNSSADCRMSVRTMDALLRDGKDDVIEFVEENSYLVTKVNDENYAKVICNPNEFTSNIIYGLRIALDCLRRDKTPNVGENNVSDYERPYLKNEFAKIKELASSGRYDLGIFHKIDNIRVHVESKLEAVNRDRMELLSKKIFVK